ncbi:hypothetical protein [Herbaspirillum lusitanum]|uniref:hypothetical protein n=1 Tax=Herbaspirillum lusitanum TaxID=213312 RepID=UPI00037FC854|nr:hypothetical protein [Herbaspirillum lusitanum]
MEKININRIKITLVLLACCTRLFAEPTITNQTTKQNSPIFSGVKGDITVNYGDRERIGKKLAIRELYLIPVDKISRRSCAPEKENCKDTFEAVFIYMKIQSIWPEPFLITASSVDVIAPKNNITLGPGIFGKNVIPEKITQNEYPKDLLFQPGETKILGLSKGLKLNGILAFFSGEVLEDQVMDLKTPFGIDYIGRVDDLNKFLEKKYGRGAAIRIRLFEKDYKALLTTTAYLDKGGDFFTDGDVRKSHYNFQHDAFIGEVLYQLKGGKESFFTRIPPKSRSDELSK